MNTKDINNNNNSSNAATFWLEKSRVEQNCSLVTHPQPTRAGQGRAGQGRHDTTVKRRQDESQSKKLIIYLRARNVDEQPTQHNTIHYNTIQHNNTLVCASEIRLQQRKPRLLQPRCRSRATIAQHNKILQYSTSRSVAR
jgi:hypothetical protein